jgi:hypothetical protein
MAHSFDIRFGRSGGIAALFDAAGNSFGWKGGGRLQIDAQGMNFALKRGLVSLLAPRRSQRIPAERINEVYREGDALRVEFATDENPRATLPFWARDRDTAARIVRLLPTSRTVEIEDGADEPGKIKMARRTPLWAAVAVVMIVTSGAMFIRYQRPGVATPAVVATIPALETPSAAEIPSSAIASSADAEVTSALPIERVPATAVAYSVPVPTMPTTPKPVPAPDQLTTPDEARKLAMLAEDPVDWTSPPPSSLRAVAEASARAARMARLGSEDAGDAEGFVPMEVPDIHVPTVVVPIRQTTLAYDSARNLLSAFESAAATLTEGYRSERARFDADSLDARTFANRLDALEMRWQTLSEGLLKDRRYADPELTGLRITLLSAVIHQRVFLTGYGAGLRDGDQARIERAFQELARAEEALARARQYVN